MTTVARLFGLGDPDEWRVGANGLTFLAHHADTTTYLNHPAPSAVVSSALGNDEVEAIQYLVSRACGVSDDAAPQADQSESGLVKRS